jgi:small subunit ribosomal protein S26e
MPVKRRNHGRNKNNRGYVKPIVCVNCGKLCPKDKAVKMFTIRDIVDASSKKDLEENKAFETYIIPKLYIKMQYCVGCGIHARIVKVRSVKERKNRLPPPRVQRDATGKPITKTVEAK